MEKLRVDTDYSLSKKQAAMDEKVKGLENDREREAQRAQERYDLVENKLRAALEFHAAQKHQMGDDADARLKDLQDQYQRRVADEAGKVSRLQRNVDNARVQRDQVVQDLEVHYTQQFEKIRENQEAAMQEWRTEYDRACDLLKVDGLKFEAALTNTEEEAERELAQLTAEQRKKLQQSSEKSADANREVERHKQEVMRLQQTVRSVEANLTRVRKERKEVAAKLEESLQMCAKVDDQLRERDSVIALREEHILRLREAEKHLEGFRFVLFHKVRSLEAE